MAITATPQYNHQYYLIHKDEIMGRSKSYYETNKDRILAISRLLYILDKDAILARNRTYYVANRDKILNHKSQWNKGYREGKRLEVMTALGNKCGLCGFTDSRVLQIDHIHNNGNSEIRRMGNIGRNSMRYYNHVLGNISEFQLLCANCNWLKELEHRKIHTRYYRNN